MGLVLASALAVSGAAAAGLGEPVRVTLDGVGGARPGMTVAAVSTAWGMPLRPDYEVRPSCGTARVTRSANAAPFGSTKAARSACNIGAVREVRAGVWHWETQHPEWNERQWWGPLVSSYAIDDGTRLVLFDPLLPPPEIDNVAQERETAIVLTCPWHRRDAEALAERYGARLYVPPPDAGDPSPVDGTVYKEGDRLPVGVEAFPGMEPNDLVLWVESHGALVAGDTLQDRGDGMQFLGDLTNNVPAGFDVEQIRAGLQPLLALPVEVVLLTHGAPMDRAALERALAT